MTTLEVQPTFLRARITRASIAKFVVVAISWVTTAFFLWVMVYCLTLLGVRLLQ